MKKDYQKPEVELISLAATEAVTAAGEGVNGDLTTGSSIFGN